MATRYEVSHSYAKWKGTVYTAGQLLPADFTERDRVRHVNSRRLIPVEVPDEPSALPKVSEPVIATKTVQVPKVASGPTAPANKPTGTKTSTVVKPVTTIKK